tara:strand:+ start:497 stop:1192 length:696 start_codon:yes stop_codon:yes gene_type:complete
MNNVNNKVSVLMSVYNNEKDISNSIKSVINQTHKNIELLIVDDGSQDNTLKICKEQAKEHKNIKLYENNKNIGLTKSLNKLIDFASGDYIARQDADDVSDLKRIEKQLKFLHSKNLDACCTRANIKNTKKIIPGFSFYIPLKMIINFKNPFIHGTLLIKKDTLNKLGNYDERFIYSQDYRLMKNLILSSYKVKIMNETLYKLNMENNISNKFKDDQKYYADCVKKDLDPTI